MSNRVLSTISLLLVGCTTQYTQRQLEPEVQYSEMQILDVLETALRHRLAIVPLPRHATCYVYIERGHVTPLKFAARFSDYHFVVRVDVAQQPYLVPWRSLRLGGTMHNHAWVVVGDPAGRMIYELRRKDGHWIVVGEEEPILA